MKGNDNTNQIRQDEYEEVDNFDVAIGYKSRADGKSYYKTASTEAGRVILSF